MIANKIGKISGKVVNGTKRTPGRLKRYVDNSSQAFKLGWEESNPPELEPLEDPFGDPKRW